MSERKRLIEILNNAPIGYEKLGQRFYKHILENMVYLTKEQAEKALKGGAK